jgi:hypothetical protein
VRNNKKSLVSYHCSDIRVPTEDRVDDVKDRTNSMRNWSMLSIKFRNTIRKFC